MRRHRGAMWLIALASMAAGCATSGPQEVTGPPPNTPTSPSSSEAMSNTAVTHQTGPGATHWIDTTVATVTVSVDAATANFYSQIATVFGWAQAQVYSLEAAARLEQSYGWPVGPDVFPAPGWAKFFDDQAALVHETSHRLRDVAPLAPDPERFTALVDAWERQGQLFEDLANAARLSDDGTQFDKLREGGLLVPGTTIEPGADSLRQFLIASPGYNGPVVIIFGPDAGE